jgi:hypothetical protein
MPEDQIPYIRDLAREIFVTRMQHLPADYWDFRPLADASITAAEVFTTALDEGLPLPSGQAVPPPAA